MSKSNQHKGKLIVFEGIDHVGKSTISSAVFDDLKKKGVSCSYYSFPGKKEGTLGKIIYEIHHGRGGIPTSNINPISLQILHIAAHIDVLERDILPDVKNGKIVILDRFWWSTYAYGIGDGISEELLRQIILPEKILLRTISRMQYIYVERQEKEKDFSEEKSKKILQAYDFLCTNINNGYLCRINNNGTIEDAIMEAIHFIVFNEVNE